MTRRTRTIRIAATAAAVAACAIVAATAWLGSSQGLAWAARKVVQLGGGAVTVEGIEGSLLGEVRGRRLQILGGNFRLEADMFVLNWQPAALLRGGLHFGRASATTLRYQSLSTAPAKPPASLALPFDLSIAALEISRLEIGGLPAIDNLRLGYSGGRTTHDIRLLQTQSAGWNVDGTLQIATLSPFPITGQLQAVRDATTRALQARATVTGTLEELQIAITGSGRGATMQSSAVLHPYAEQPVARFEAQARELDLSAWATELPRTRLTVDANAQTIDSRLTGTLRAENAAAGTQDSGRLPLSAISAHYSGSGRDWTLPALELQVSGGGRITGSAALRGDNGTMDVQLRDIDPARIDSRLRPVRVSGTAKLSGNTKAQQVTARLDGAGLQLQLAAKHAGDLLTIDSARLQAGTGSAEFTGQLGLTAARAFTLRGSVSRLDPSRLAAVPSALLNGRISASGNIHPQWQAQVTVDLADSRWRNLPFTAAAAFSTQKSRWFEGTAQAAIGRNRLEVKGSYGHPQDQLNWTLAAEDLRALGPTLGGRLSGRGTVTGATDGPALDFTVDGQQLVAGKHRIARLDGRGTLAAGREGPLQFLVNATGLQLAETRIDTLQLSGNGTRARHVLEGSAKGRDATAVLRATGGIDPHARWIGTLDQLETGLPWPLRLNGPAQITAGRDLLIIEQLRGTLFDGEFGPASLRAENGRIDTQGAFRGVAAGRLLPHGNGLESNNLRLGGEWSLKLDDAVNGDVSLYRESGDLTLGGGTPVPLALRKALLNLAAADSAISIALDIDSETMGTAAARLQTRMFHRDSGWLLPADAPLTGSANLDFRSLAWLRAMLPGVDRVEGQLAVQLRADGTIAAPHLVGTITGDRIALRAVGAGVDLREGRLRATLDGKQFRLDEFELKAGKGRITASGTAELAGGLHSVELQARAEHAQILLAPQWSATIDGTGRLGLRDRAVTLEGKFSLDEGRYDPGTRSKPRLGNDVIVRSAKPETAVKSAALPVKLDVSIDLKDKLTVRGNGLDALLGGSLRITTRGAALAALGDVRTVRGQYSVFGQQLDIERGTLTFAGPLTDPGLDLRAIRKIQTVEVGVEVTGSLQRPSVKLVSVPDMSDTDRLAWLILGRDPAGTDRAQLAVLQAAALGLTSSGGTPIQRQIAQGVGLDEIGFAGSENSALGAVTLGKKLTEQLSIRLEQTLGGTAGSLLRMDYMLSERWRLRGTAGAENAGDILFTLRFD